MDCSIFSLNLWSNNFKSVEASAPFPPALLTSRLPFAILFGIAQE